MIIEPDVVRIEGSEKYHPRGASSCGCIACQTDSYVTSGWGLFSSDIQSNAGCFYCRCCCDPASREVVAEKQTELNLEQEELMTATGVVQIEGAEKYQPRGASGCGYCAEQTDVRLSLCCDFISCDVQNNAGVLYCRGCC